MCCQYSSPSAEQVSWVCVGPTPKHHPCKDARSPGADKGSYVWGLCCNRGGKHI